MEYQGITMPNTIQPKEYSMGSDKGGTLYKSQRRWQPVRALSVLQ